MDIKYIATSFISKPDIYGNSYHFCRIIRCSDEKEAKGIISGGPINLSSAMYDIVNNHKECVHNIVILGIRDWNRQAKGLKHLGCTSEEIIKNANTLWDGGELKF